MDLKTVAKMMHNAVENIPAHYDEEQDFYLLTRSDIQDFLVVDQFLTALNNAVNAVLRIAEIVVSTSISLDNERG